MAVSADAFLLAQPDDPGTARPVRGLVSRLRGAMGTKIAGREFVLVVEQSVVHLPKSALCAGRLCCLGRQLGARVHVVQRQVPPDIAQVVPERDQQLAYDNFGLAAVLRFAMLLSAHQAQVCAAR